MQLELTYKAIAMMCGFMVYKSKDNVYYYSHNKYNTKSAMYATEYEAWRKCCINSDLVQETEI